MWFKQKITRCKLCSHVAIFITTMTSSQENSIIILDAYNERNPITIYALSGEIIAQGPCSRSMIHQIKDFKNMSIKNLYSIMTEVITDFHCKTCKKYYSSYQSLWIHNKKFHNSSSNDLNKDNKDLNIYINYF